MKKIFRFLKNYKKECVLAPLFKLFEATLELFVPLVMAAIIDRGIEDADFVYIGQMGGILFLLAAVGLTAALVAQYFAAKAAVGFATELRSELFRHIRSLSFGDVDQVGTSTLITRLTSDTNQLQAAVNMSLRLFLRSPFVVLGAMVMAFTIDVKAAFIFVIMIPLLSLVIFGVMAVSIPMYRRVQEALDRILCRTRENLTGVRVQRAFNKQKEEEEKFEEENRNLNEIQMLVGRVASLTNPVTYLIVNVSVIALIWVGAVRVDSGFITQGQVVALVNYTSQILVELIKLANTIVMVNKAIACGNRVQEVFDWKPGLQSPKEVSHPTDESTDVIHFEHAGLVYPGTHTESLTDIHFSVKRGETVGIIGGTGSGKTSLVHLIPRFYDITSGHLKVNGVEVREWSLQELRARVGIVLQKSVLFEGTIRSNLCWGKEDASDEEMWQALRIAQAVDIVKGKEGELDAVVEQGGRNFSGGQKQRLSIARALARKPEILILDDSASALDYATDAALRKAIREELEGMTLVIVSQRAASVRNADRIVVLDDGETVGMGTHEELMGNCEVYREIYESQYGKGAR